MRCLRARSASIPITTIDRLISPRKYIKIFSPFDQLFSSIFLAFYFFHIISLFVLFALPPHEESSIKPVTPYTKRGRGELFSFFPVLPMPVPFPLPCVFPYASKCLYWEETKARKKIKVIVPAWSRATFPNSNTIKIK